MANRIYFQPPQYVTPTRYEITVAPTSTGVWNLYGYVPHEIPGPNWQDPPGRFFFDDPNGTDTTVYRVKAQDPLSNVLADTGPFQPDAAVEALLKARVKVDHNFGAIDALQFVTESGAAIPDAEVRLFRRPDFEAGRRDVPLYVVQTRADGRWTRPVYLEPGMDYTLIFDKPAAYISQATHITV